jgi:hypothetical protein
LLNGIVGAAIFCFNTFARVPAGAALAARGLCGARFSGGNRAPQRLRRIIVAKSMGAADGTVASHIS